MSVHASANIELMHYKRVIVNWLCDRLISNPSRQVVCTGSESRSGIQVPTTGAVHRERAWGHARSLYTAPGVWTFGRSKVGVGGFGQCCGQLALAKNAVRCIYLGIGYPDIYSVYTAVE